MRSLPCAPRRRIGRANCTAGVHMTSSSSGSATRQILRTCHASVNGDLLKLAKSLNR